MLGREAEGSRIEKGLSPHLCREHHRLVHLSRFPCPFIQFFSFQTLAFHGGVTPGVTSCWDDWTGTTPARKYPPLLQASDSSSHVWSGLSFCTIQTCASQVFSRPIDITLPLGKLLLLFLPSTRRLDGDFHSDVTERAKCTIFAHLDKEWVTRNVFGAMAAGFGLEGIFFRCSFARVLCLDADLFRPVRSPLPSSCWARGLRLAWRDLSVLGRVETRRQKRSG